MSKEIAFTVRWKEGVMEVMFEASRVLLAGYTGRNQEVVRRHIEELKKIGVPAPEKVPTLYRVASYLITNDKEVEIKGDKTSGEVEYAILMGDKDIYVTVGSDHTDRELEKVNVEKAKQMCQKIIAKEVWLYSEMKDHWDNVILRSYAIKEGKKVLYQEDKLKALLGVEDLLKEFNIKERGTVLFSGTIRLRGKLIYADEFQIEMEDSELDRIIRHQYRVHII